MTDMFTKARRSEIMARITDKDTEPELRVRRALHKMGRRFRLHRKDLPGKPDIVLPKLRIVIFVHGCFWHGHDCKKGSSRRRPKSNTGYWNKKLDRNMRRDAEHAAKLRELGWKRVVIWACETGDPEQLEVLLQAVLQSMPAGETQRSR
jgi:DNA mismatch endonuclease (patch repair protein)